MHARELVELAAIVSAHGPALVRSSQPIPAAGIERYWTASKVRLDRWAVRLKELAARSRHDGLRADASAVLEEILTGEMLTRVWTAALCDYDMRHGADNAAPIARSVMIGHMEARHRVLTLMVGSPANDENMQLNRLRRRVECWTDLLVGYLMDRHDLSEFAFDADRARDFAADLRDRSTLAGDGLVRPLMTASLRAAFQQSLAAESPNADLNAQIAAAVLECLPAGMFDSTGLPASLWLMRVMSFADDTQVMLDDLLAPGPSSPPARLSPNTPPHLRRRQ